MLPQEVINPIKKILGDNYQLPDLKAEISTKNEKMFQIFLLLDRAKKKPFRVIGSDSDNGNMVIKIEHQDMFYNLRLEDFNNFLKE